MGCDIHLHTEVKINDKWEHYGAPSVNRNYALFERMAGVRGSGQSTPISSPRGLPDDISPVTRIDAERWGSDGHSHSFLNAKEVLGLEDWYRERLANRRGLDQFPENQWGYFFGNTWGGFLRYPSDAPEGVEDIRFVFWFDS